MRLSGLRAPNLLTLSAASLCAAILQGCGGLRKIEMQTTQTAFNGGTPDLLKEMPKVHFQRSAQPTERSIIVDRTQQFQEMLGFGGAFTEAAAVNWRKLSKGDQHKVIHHYFASPEEGGHGYTLGRVPMGSCDFTLASYNFDDASNDEDMAHFDKTVAHDEESGMLPMIRAAQEMVSKRHNQNLKVYASPWSPPAWMKLPVDGKQSMTGSATPTGLDPKYQRAWANYFSAFVSAYKERDVALWGVTVQNEPEFAAAWEACVYTPASEAAFVRDHLGPVLNKDHPGLKIMGFDHNKDHVVEWASILYKDREAAKYLDGVGVHWYGGLNTQHLNTTHFIAPDKFILATEACNCGGVVFKNKTKDWWARAELIAIDILEDIKWWAVGWTDWNLVLDTTGGPNHLGNNCDANIIADPSKSVQGETIILQASYYYMGHFSRFIPPGSHRIGLTVDVSLPPILPKNVQEKMMKFNPCSDGNGMTWSYDVKKRLTQYGLCAELVEDDQGIKMRQCSASTNQQWTVEDADLPGPVPWFGASEGKRFRSVYATAKCITDKKVSGPVVGMDPGVDVQAGLAEDCGEVSEGQIQTFVLSSSAGQSFPAGFHLQTGTGDCMIPVGADAITFDAVAFETPHGEISIVAMNLGEADISFEIYDTESQSGTTNVTVPMHGIASFRLHGNLSARQFGLPVIVAIALAGIAIIFGGCFIYRKHRPAPLFRVFPEASVSLTRS